MFLTSVFDKFSDITFTVDFCATLFLVLILILIVLRNLKRKFTYIFYTIVYILLAVSMLFGLSTLSIVILLALGIGTIVFLFVNMAEIRALIANPMKSKAKSMLFGALAKPVHGKEKHSYSPAAVYKSVYDAIVALSKSKTGALMTFQKKMPLTDIMKSGSVINAPVTAELLQTIFYPGTRLHDGAVVIKDNIIVAASVYYTPTTKALTGKYGARHRAAIGISEISDSVTVIVSEETGRVSIAYNGELEGVTLDNFLRVFEDFMEDVKGN